MIYPILMKKILFILLTCLLPCTLWAQLSKAQRNYVDIILTPDHADWLYRPGEKPVVCVAAYRHGILQRDAKVVWQAGEEMMPLKFKGTATTKADGAHLTLPTLNNPGFLQCRVSVEVAGEKLNEQIKLGFSPEKITPTVKMPDDFRSFWKRQIDAVANEPLEFTRTLNTTYSTSDVLVYEVSFRVDAFGHRMNGWLIEPAKKGDYPAVLLPPGAGIKAQLPTTEYAKKGIITLQIEIHGLPLQADEQQYQALRKAFGDYMFFQSFDRERYYYKHVYQGCVRAVDVLRSLPECNGRIGVTGGSQGGALAIVTAALSPYIQAVAAFYPALCDMTGYLHNRAGGWPHIFNNENSQVYNKPMIVETLAYYDVVNFARLLKVPAFFSFGYNDNTCPPTLVKKEKRGDFKL